MTVIFVLLFHRWVAIFFFFNSVTISHEKSCYITEHQSEVDTTKSVGGGPSWSWSPLENRFLFFSILSKLQIFTIRSPISCQKVNKRLERRLVITITGPKSIRHCYGRGATLRTWWYGNWGGEPKGIIIALVWPYWETDTLRIPIHPSQTFSPSVRVSRYIDCRRSRRIRVVSYTRFGRFIANLKFFLYLFFSYFLFFILEQGYFRFVLYDHDDDVGIYIYIYEYACVW